MKRIFSIFLISALTVVAAMAQHSGVIVNHVPASEGNYIGSPGLCILPDGTYLASNDYFGPKSKERSSAITVVFRSDDKGQTWKQVSEVQGMFWGTLFNVKDQVYLLGTKRNHGNIVIRRSEDKGKTWTKAYSAETGVLFEGEYHTAPVPIVEYKGRLWRAFEYATAPLEKWPEQYSAVVISVPVGADLLDASKWRKSEICPSDKPHLDKKFRGWLEGNVVYDVNSKSLVDMLRVHSPYTDYEYAAILDISRNGKKLSFDPETSFVKMPGGSKKFTIRYDEESGRYWSLVNYVPVVNPKIQADRMRNVLALASSPDLRTWYINDILIQHPDCLKHGYQYVEWLFDGNNIVYLVRTADDDEEGGADNYHNANFLTFHRKADFRKTIENEIKYE